MILKIIIQIARFISGYGEARETWGKVWYKSRTLWVNFLALIGLIVQWKFTGFAFGLEEQTTLLAAINVLLRLQTKNEVKAKR